jgi:hypothetical protein
MTLSTMGKKERKKEGKKEKNKGYAHPRHGKSMFRRGGDHPTSTPPWAWSDLIKLSWALAK